jgi:chemotaxis signal transduction protein
MTRREILIVRAGERWLGVFAEDAAGVERGRALATPLPHAPAAVLGLVSVRGRILTLLDPLALLNERRDDVHTRTAPAFILALRGDEQLALAVDSAERLREINVDEIGSPATVAEAKLAHGIFQDEEASIVILDVARLFAAAVEGMEHRRRRRVLEDES